MELIHDLLQLTLNVRCVHFCVGSAGGKLLSMELLLDHQIRHDTLHRYLQHPCEAEMAQLHRNLNRNEVRAGLDVIAVGFQALTWTRLWKWGAG